MSLMRSGQVEAAIEHFEQLRRLAPSFDTFANLAGAYARANRPADALATAQVAVNMARARGRISEAAQLEAWAKNYRQSVNTAPQPQKAPGATDEQPALPATPATP
jgi:hypothetical protein